MDDRRVSGWRAFETFSAGLESLMLFLQGLCFFQDWWSLCVREQPVQEVWLKCQFCGFATGRLVAHWRAECVSLAHIVQLTGLPVEQ